MKKPKVKTTKKKSLVMSLRGSFDGDNWIDLGKNLVTDGLVMFADLEKVSLKYLVAKIAKR